MDEYLENILGEFVIEAGEILDRLDIDFVQLEKNSTDKKLVENIFRGMHTLKGSSGFFAFKRLETLAHACETLLSKVREGEITLNAGRVTVLLHGFDSLRKIIAGISEVRVEPDGDDASIVALLLAIANGETVSEQAVMRPGADSDEGGDQVQAVEPRGSLQSLGVSPGEVTVGDTVVPADALVAVSAKGSPSLQPPVNRATVNAEASKNHELAAPVKVNVELLDKLMNLVSELVLARNRLLPFVTDNTDLHFSSAVRTIDMLTLELQERMMKTRMQPISQLWSKFPRLVRDLSNELGKSVELIQEGAETELDRTLLEAIRDPLVHIVRNTVDHGIEIPATRLQANKPAAGKLVLQARHENGMVVVEIIDDGGGIDFEKVRDRSVEKGFWTAEKASKLSDQELIETLFLPGFSTKDAVTSLSGRGVGMDVVKTNITQIGGTIEVESPRGSIGTKIRLKIPLTLAIMPALFVRSESERFAIPQNSLLEMVRLNLATDPNGLEDFFGTPVFRLRGQLHPLLFLNRHLELSDRTPGPESAINIAVVQSGGVRFGLVVDEVLNMQEVVVKPIGPLFKGLLDFAGATILGNGRVALILDVDGIAMSSGLIAKVQSHQLHEAVIVEKLTSIAEETTMLLFSIDGMGSMALPLKYINRFEIFAADRIQHNGTKLVVNYGQDIMPLIVVKDFIGGTRRRGLDGSRPISVIVHYVRDQPYGLVVDQIFDIVQVPSKLFALAPPQRGLLGCSLLGEKVINILDLPEIMMLRNLQEEALDQSAPEVLEI